MIKAIATVKWPTGRVVKGRLEARWPNQTVPIKWEHPQDDGVLPRMDPAGPWLWLRFHMQTLAENTGGVFSEEVSGDWPAEDDLFFEGDESL